MKHISDMFTSPLGRLHGHGIIRSKTLCFRDNEVVRVGYARVSRNDQRLQAQRDAPLADDCERVFVEKASSGEAERSALRQPFNYCREACWWRRGSTGWRGHYGNKWI